MLHLYSFKGAATSLALYDADSAVFAHNAAVWDGLTFQLVLTIAAEKVVSATVTLSGRNAPLRTNSARPSVSAD